MRLLIGWACWRVMAALYRRGAPPWWVVGRGMAYWRKSLSGRKTTEIA